MLQSAKLTKLETLTKKVLRLSYDFELRLHKIVLHNGVRKVTTHETGKWVDPFRWMCNEMGACRKSPRCNQMPRHLGHAMEQTLPSYAYRYCRHCNWA
jgi:hypothetical protein